MKTIPMMFYAQWYQEEIKPKLSKKEKEKLLMKISDISLEKPITELNVNFDKKEFPELVPYTHTEKITGLQLYAVMTELFEELHPKQAKQIGKSYPELRLKKKIKEVV